MIDAKLLNNGKLNFVTKEEELLNLIALDDIKDYLKIPSFKAGDKIKISKYGTVPLSARGKEFTFISMNSCGKLIVSEKVSSSLFINDIQEI